MRAYNFRDQILCQECFHEAIVGIKDSFELERNSVMDPERLKAQFGVRERVWCKRCGTAIFHGQGYSED
jgi:hypothetical protein